MRRLTGVLAAVSATWLTLALATPMPMSSAAIDTADASIPVDAATTLEMHVTANCITAQANCLFNTAANLRTPEGPIGFPGDLYARQNTTVRTMDRSVYVDTDFDAPNTRLFKSLTDVELATVYFGGGRRRSSSFRATPGLRTGAPGDREPTPASSCAHTSRSSMPA